MTFAQQQINSTTKNPLEALRDLKAKTTPPAEKLNTISNGMGSISESIATQSTIPSIPDLNQSEPVFSQPATLKNDPHDFIFPSFPDQETPPTQPVVQDNFVDLNSMSFPNGVETPIISNNFVDFNPSKPEKILGTTKVGESRTPVVVEPTPIIRHSSVSQIPEEVKRAINGEEFDEVKNPEQKLEELQELIKNFNNKINAASDLEKYLSEAVRTNSENPVYN
jgi:hypothetical protein